MGRGFLISATKPKALVFFAGLFPAFLSPDAPLAPQLLRLGAVYLTLDGLCLALYALGATRLAALASGRGGDRLAAGLFLAAGLVLALK